MIRNVIICLLTFIASAALAGDDGGRIQVVKSGKGDARAIAGGKAGVERILDCPGPAAGCPYLGLFVGHPGLEVPEHRHEDSEEWLYVLEGSGVLTSGGQDIPLCSGDTVRIPIGVAHAFRVTGDRDFRAVQVFPQGGPQSRFRPAPATP